MLPVAPLPSTGEVFLDTRGSGRALRVSFHHVGPDLEGDGGDLVVLSLWNGGTCTGTFRLALQDVPDLVDALRDGLARSYDRHVGAGEPHGHPSAGADRSLTG